MKATETKSSMQPLLELHLTTTSFNISEPTACTVLKYRDSNLYVDGHDSVPSKTLIYALGMFYVARMD